MFAPRTKLVTLQPQSKDDWDENKSDETQKTVAPPQTQCLKHLVSEERERATKAGSKEIVASRNGCEVFRVRVAEIIQHSCELYIVSSRPLQGF